MEEVDQEANQMIENQEVIQEIGEVITAKVEPGVTARALKSKDNEI